MDEPVVQCYGGLGDLENRKWRTEADNGVHRERDHDGAVHQYGYMDISRESSQ